MDTKLAKPDPVEVVAEALRVFGDLTAAAIAEKIGMGYSTVTPKLRALEAAGRAERVRANGRTFWRLSTPPAQETAVDAGHAADSGDTAGVPDDAAEPPAAANPAPPADAVPTETDAGANDTSHPAGTDATPPDTSPPAEDANSEEATQVDTPAPDPALDPQPQSDPTAAAPNDQTSGADDAPAVQPTPKTAPAASATDGKTRRPPGALDRTALQIMQANPDTPYKVTDLARLIDQADAADGHNYSKASPGAVVLACDRLVDKGNAAKVAEKPATYQLASPQPGNP